MTINETFLNLREYLTFLSVEKAITWYIIVQNNSNK